MAYIIAEPCVNTKDTACVDVCPVDCIHPRKDEANFAEVPMLYIDPIECIDCGACVPVCPVSAILKSLMAPDCTTNRPSHGSPSATRISSFRIRRTTQWLARIFNSAGGNTAKNETRRRASTASRADIGIILSSVGMGRDMTSIVGMG